MSLTPITTEPLRPGMTRVLMDLAGVLSGFPLVNNDGTDTQKIEANPAANPNSLVATVTDNASAARNTKLLMAIGAAAITALDTNEAQLSIFANNAGGTVAGIQFRVNGSAVISATYHAFPGIGPRLGFFGAAEVAQQTVTGSRGGNAALASLLTALANYGLIIDNTTP